MLEHAPLERLASEGQIAAYQHDGFWQPMDTYREFLMLEEMWQSGQGAVGRVGARRVTTALVTGATGMVGAALTRRLVDDGVQVVAFVMDPDPRSELYRSGTVDAVSVVSGRLEDLDAVERGHRGARARHRVPPRRPDAGRRGADAHPC